MRHYKVPTLSDLEAPSAGNKQMYLTVTALMLLSQLSPVKSVRLSPQHKLMQIQSYFFWLPCAARCKPTYWEQPDLASYCVCRQKSTRNCNTELLSSSCRHNNRIDTTVWTHMIIFYKKKKKKGYLSLCLFKVLRNTILSDTSSI